MRGLGVAGLFGIVACAMLVPGEREARACGGCFHPEATPQAPIIESTVVNDHRMVFALSPQQTVLWDQIRYTGRPSEFAWVLPVRPGTKIELSHDEWIQALDATTQPKIIQPPPKPLGGFGNSFGGGGEESGGCGCLSSTTTDSAFASGDAVSDGGKAAPPPVQVIAQEVVGPYETVTIRSDKPKAMETWLHDHGYAVPDAVLPIITAYTEEKLDFIALRLRPGEGVSAMRPVRIVSPGADPTLPLRMVAAGIGAHVAITLYVISEGRYRPQNFPEATIDETKLVWDTSLSRSNYTELSLGVMAGAGGRTWLTEYADRPVTYGSIPQSGGTTLFDAYYGSCQGRPRASVPVEPVPDSGAPDANAPDAGDPDANAPDAGDPDAGDPDAGNVDGGTPTTDDGGVTPPPPPSTTLCETGQELCCDFDDLDVAIGELHSGNVWLTRLRAELPASALNVDLKLEAHPDQTHPVSNVHNAIDPTATATGTGAKIAPSRKTHLGTGLLVLGTALLVGRMVRRRRR